MLAAAASATATILVVPDGQIPAASMDLVRSAGAAAMPGWHVAPVSEAAIPLFFTGQKGPRADLDTEDDAPEGFAQPVHVELASSVDATQNASGAGAPAAGSVPGEGPERLKGLAGLNNQLTLQQETECLAEAIYYEGRSEPVEAQRGIGQTVINRALSGVYPSTVCGVVRQHSEKSGDCQYAFECDNLTAIAKVRSDWALAQQLAGRLLSGEGWVPEIGDATHMHSIAEHPQWTLHMQRIKRIGGIVFYRSDFGAAAIGSVPPRH